MWPNVFLLSKREERKHRHCNERGAEWSWSSRALHSFNDFESARVTILNGNLETTQSLINFVAEDPRDLSTCFELHRANLIVKLTEHGALVNLIFVADSVIAWLLDQGKFLVVLPGWRQDLLLIVCRRIGAGLAAYEFVSFVENCLYCVILGLVSQIREELHVAGPGLVPRVLVFPRVFRLSSWHRFKLSVHLHNRSILGVVGILFVNLVVNGRDHVEELITIALWDDVVFADHPDRRAKLLRLELCLLESLSWNKRRERS